MPGFACATSMTSRSTKFEHDTNAKLDTSSQENRTETRVDPVVKPHPRGETVVNQSTPLREW